MYFTKLLYILTNYFGNFRYVDTDTKMFCKQQRHYQKILIFLFCSTTTTRHSILIIKLSCEMSAILLLLLVAIEWRFYLLLNFKLLVQHMNLLNVFVLFRNISLLTKQIQIKHSILTDLYSSGSITADRSRFCPYVNEIILNKCNNRLHYKLRYVLERFINLERYRAVTWCVGYYISCAYENSNSQTNFTETINYFMSFCYFILINI